MQTFITLTTVISVRVFTSISILATLKLGVKLFRDTSLQGGNIKISRFIIRCQNSTALYIHTRHRHSYFIYMLYICACVRVKVARKSILLSRVVQSAMLLEQKAITMQSIILNSSDFSWDRCTCAEREIEQTRTLALYTSIYI